MTRLTPCIEPGCPALTLARYCPTHNPGPTRGMGISRDPAAHRRFARAVLARGFCERCGRRRQDGIRLTAHHRVGLAEGGTEHPANGQALCESCHAAVDPYFRPYRGRAA